MKESINAIMNAEGGQLWMDDIRISGIRTNPSAIKFTYTIRNFGNSPGWVHHKTIKLFFGTDLPKERELNQNDTPQVMFVPAKHFTNGNTEIGQIPQPVIDMLLATPPTIFLFVYGSINYRDIF